jgi:Na+/H+ antiporter NhaD/arsenite permease-like protein
MTPLAWGLPFVFILLSIAILPLALPRLWGRLGFQAGVAAVAALPVLFLLVPGELPRLASVLHEYSSFILMLAALYVTASGISVHGDVPAHPTTNAALLLLGGLLASFIGTTGASMLLIGLLLEVNSERKHVAHTVVFFILIVSNGGGLLTPLGDPPLYIGFLQGVPFLWTLRLFPIWLLHLVVLLGVYLIADLRAWRSEAARDIARDEMERRPVTIRGKVNFVLLALIVSATALLPAPIREAAYVALAAASLLLTEKGLRKETKFSWHPILEVAVLFAGIFVSMEPALRILAERAPTLGLVKPWQFFWATGSLSSFLDNAPTYAAFLALARGLGRPEVAGAPAQILEAISAGAVLFGAMTYIGNGPNFLVRSIAESRGVKMPSFFGYFLRAAAVLLPLFVLETFLFFRP